MACGNVHLAAADANVCHVAAGRFGHIGEPSLGRVVRGALGAFAPLCSGFENVRVPGNRIDDTPHR